MIWRTQVPTSRSAGQWRLRPNRPYKSAPKDARPYGRAFCYKGRAKETAMNVPSKGPMRIIGLAGWCGSGKTTLITKLIPFLISFGVKVDKIQPDHTRFVLNQY